MKTIVRMAFTGVACLVIGGAAAGNATADIMQSTVTATGTGWCNYPQQLCNNDDTGVIANAFAGNNGNNDYRNWLAFDVGAGAVLGATLHIWSDRFNTTHDTAAVYSLHAASAIDFVSLGTGPSLGSVSAGVANTGADHYVDILLNPAGVAYLNGHQGQQVLFGGTVTPGVFTEFFGYTEGTPVALLSVTAMVPEPASYALLLAGLGLVGARWRARRA